MADGGTPDDRALTPPTQPGAVMSDDGASSDAGSDAPKKPEKKSAEDHIYDKIDSHVEKIEAHDAILAQAQRELAKEVQRGRERKQRCDLCFFLRRSLLSFTSRPTIAHFCLTFTSLLSHVYVTLAHIFGSRLRRVSLAFKGQRDCRARGAAAQGGREAQRGAGQEEPPGAG